MNYRKIGNIEVSPIGMGCIGFPHGYGAVPTNECGDGVNAVRPHYREKLKIVFF